MLLRRRENGFLINIRNRCQESGNIAHGYSLQANADAKRAFAADNVDEEEGANDGGDKLDNSEDAGCEELFVLSFCTE